MTLAVKVVLNPNTANQSKVAEISLVKCLLFTTQSQVLMFLKRRAFENIVGKGENAGNCHFFPLLTIFSTIAKTEKTLKQH